MVVDVGTDIIAAQPNANYYFTVPPFVSNIYAYIQADHPVQLFGKTGAFAGPDFADCENTEPTYDPTLLIYGTDIICTVPKSVSNI